MALDRMRIQKPARRLRRLLRKMPSSAVPEDVHNFRTNARRLETVLQSFALRDKKGIRQLAKQISKLRKRAGRVRDFDVLTDYLSSLSHDPSENDCVVRLLEQLGTQREKQAKKFHDLQQQYSSSLRRRLKRTSKAIENVFPPKGDGCLNGKPISAGASSEAMALLSALKEPRQLRRSNLHDYRLKVKELRNLLHMAENSQKQPFVDRLGQVKDAIGEWHDWEVLAVIAKDSLDHGRNCRLAKDLWKTANTKYEEALRLSLQMRHDDLRITKRQAKKLADLRPAPQVWSATIS